MFIWSISNFHDFLNFPPSTYQDSKKHMRVLLDKLYALSGGVAAAFLLAICIAVMLQVGANMIDSAARLITGEPVGLVVPSYSEFTGFFLVAASFLALANSLRHGAHIRVTLLIRGLPSGPRRLIEIWCCTIALAFAAFFAWHSVALVWDSYVYNDVSPGIVAVPIWIPQMSMPLGLIVFTIALADTIIAIILRDKLAFLSSEEDTRTSSTSNISGTGAEE